MAEAAPKKSAADAAMPVGKQGQGILAESNTNELVFAVVGHVGSGTSVVAKMLAETLSEHSYKTKIIKARDGIEKWAESNGLKVPPRENKIAIVTEMQDLGDLMREKTNDNGAVARAAIGAIRRFRAEATKVAFDPKAAVAPTGEKIATIVDALRHPAEAEVLRGLYDSGFTLIGVVCDEQTRLKRLADKYSDGGTDNAQKFMERDAKAQKKSGQRVSDAFHLSDFFIDNSENMKTEKGQANKDWGVPDDLKRLVAVVTHEDIVRPSHEETAMFAAEGAKMRSACLSRQVGAALLDSQNVLLSVGTNEVPSAGGGTYHNDSRLEDDGRCAFRQDPSLQACSNTREQKRIVEEIVDSIASVMPVSPENRVGLAARIQASRISSLLEFSRAVHAEMDALLSATRQGRTTSGSRCFVTTYPCHYCARHLVAAGVTEVHYIEPYPKSKALDLHSDSITHRRSEVAVHNSTGQLEKRLVLFKAFTGVAPRMYVRAFLKDRDLKSPTGEKKIGPPDFSRRWNQARLSYPDLELQLEIS